MERIAWKGLLARGSLIAAVSVIIGVSTLMPLIKYSPPASAPAVFAPPPVTNQSVSSTVIAAPIAKQPSPDFSSNQEKVSTTADEAMPAVHSEQPRPTETQPLSDESSPAASQSAVQSAPPIIAATEQAKTAKSARAKRTAKTRKHARHRAPPFSYTRQIAWH